MEPAKAKFHRVQVEPAKFKANKVQVDPKSMQGKHIPTRLRRKRKQFRCNLKAKNFTTGLKWNPKSELLIRTAFP